MNKDQLALRARASALIPLLARAASADALQTNRVMFMPGGVHRIVAGFGDSASADVSVKVDESTAAVLNASLAELNARHAPQRALFDKEHEGKEALAWPVLFEWSNSPQPGIYARVEFSSLGREFIQGKVMRAFSGSFFTDAALPKRAAVKAGKTYKPDAGKRGSTENPARITGLDFPYAGTFTNNPAFREILPLWAKNAAGASESSEIQLENNMKLTPEKLASLQARKADLEQGIPSLRARAQADQNDAGAAEELSGAETELQSVTAQLQAHDLAVRNESLEQAVLAQRSKDADDAVKAAIRRGAIAPKDEALQATWKKKCTEDPEMITILASMKGSPALAPAPQRLTLSGIQITREDSGSVLKAYSQERDPKKKAAIYARDLSKRISDGEDLPIQANNSLGTLTAEIVTQRALELLTIKLPILNAIATDFSDENVAFGQQVTSRIVGIPTVGSYDPDTGYPTADSTTVDVPVTISAHRSVQVAFGANELSGTSRRLFDEQSPAMQYAIGKDIIDAVLANITAANFTEAPTTEALVDFGRRSVISMGGALSDRGVPDMERTLLLKGDYFDALFSDETVVALAAQQRAEIITSGTMIPLHGFNVFRTANLPTTNNLAGFGFSKSALVAAGRLPADYASVLPGATGGGTTQVITESRTGFSVVLTQFVNHQLGKAFARLAYMLGTAKGQIKAGQRLTSQ
jgi:hypothetical protein